MSTKNPKRLQFIATLISLVSLGFLLSSWLPSPFKKALGAKEIKTLMWHHTTLNGLAFSADNKSLVSQDEENLTVAWDIASEKLRSTKAAPGVAQFVPGVDQIISLSDARVVTWNMRNGAVRYGFPKASYFMALSPDGSTLMTGREATEAIAWNFRTEEPLWRFVTKAQVYGACFSPDGKNVAIYCEDNTVYALDRKSGQQIRQFQESAQIHDIVFASDGRQLLIVTQPGIVIRRSMRTGVATSISVPDFSKAVFSSNGKVLLLDYWLNGIGDNDRSLMTIIDPLTGKTVNKFYTPISWTTAISHDGKLVAVSEISGTIHLFSPE